eukprot:8728351-Heterocapsa_arctica.AAC.1
MSGSSGLPGVARMTPARHLRALGGLPRTALATDVLTLFLRSPETPVSSAPYIPPAMSRTPTSFALFGAPTRSDMILLDLPSILRTISLRTLVLLGAPSVASTPRSRAENDTFRSSPRLSWNAAFTALLAPGPMARMTEVVVCSFCPIFPRPSLVMP